MESLMSLTLGQIIGGIMGFLAIISVFVEITPIKINPVSSLLHWVGKKTSSEVMEQIALLKKNVSNLENKVTSMEESNNERNAILCRVRILRFGDEIRRHEKHSKDSFDQVFSDMDEYDGYCRAHRDFRNNKTVVTQEKIREEYAKCMDKNDFL